MWNVYFTRPADVVASPVEEYLVCRGDDMASDFAEYLFRGDDPTVDFEESLFRGRCSTCLCGESTSRTLIT